MDPAIIEMADVQPDHRAGHSFSAVPPSQPFFAIDPLTLDCCQIAAVQRIVEMCQQRTSAHPNRRQTLSTAGTSHAGLFGVCGGFGNVQVSEDVLDDRMMLQSTAFPRLCSARKVLQWKATKNSRSTPKPSSPRQTVEGRYSPVKQIKLSFRRASQRILFSTSKAAK